MPKRLCGACGRRKDDTDILQHYLDEGAIKDVDLSNDMKVNRGDSTGDSVYFDARIHAVDAAEKLYFTVITD